MDTSLTHIFSLNQDKNSPVVTLPNIPWDGQYANVIPENVTYINLRAFGDLVEDIYAQIIRLASESNLELIIAGGGQSLLQKYTVLINPTGSIGHDA
jgi:hypothetical protein